MIDLPPPVLEVAPEAPSAALTDVPVLTGASPDSDRWIALMRRLCEAQLVQTLTKELALNTQWLSEDGEWWMLRTDKSTLNTASNRDKLQAALAQIGHAVNLRIEVGPVNQTAALRIASEQAQWLEDAERKVLEDPYVQQLMREFGARIVPGSIQPRKKDPSCSTKDNSQA